jgi:hypothetical protein
VLYLDSSGRIHRRLAWAEFRGGAPVPLPRSGDAGGTPGTSGEHGGSVVPADPGDGDTWYEETREL